MALLLTIAEASRVLAAAVSLSPGIPERGNAGRHCLPYCEAARCFCKARNFLDATKKLGKSG
jgi:hypothetical protein